MCWFFCFVLLTFIVYIHREHLNLMQWAVSKFLGNIFCLWVGKDNVTILQEMQT